MNSTAAVSLYTGPGCAMTVESAMPPKRSSTSRPPAATAEGPHVLIRPAKDSQTALVWLLAVAVSFLSVGIAGVASPVVDLPPAARQTPATLPPEVPVQDITMADLSSAEEKADAPAAAADAQESAIPDTPPEPLLTLEDIFEVPPAPGIEPALRVLAPAPMKPAVTPRPTTTTATPRPSPRPAAAPTPGGGTPGGTGPAAGTARAGSGGKGKFPKPPYPAFAKKQGLTGTVTLSVRVSPDGSATSVSVSGSSGSSQLDSYAASWVQSRWRWPSGDARSFRLPVSFKLR